MTMERNSFMDATACRDERFESLKRLYPELVRDGKIDVGALKELFGEEAVDEGEMGYNLYWPGKREAKKLARKEAEGTLVPVLGDGVDEAGTGNIYIEGDNLEVLRILRKSYAERVKMIYIDPPYNTGKDFIYPDNYREPVEDYLKFTGEVDEKGVSLVANPKSGGAYHRRWLGMMLPRLQLARELLAKDGVIFISIDNNEQANLKLLCDEVFGEENFVECFLWNKTSTPPALSHKSRKTHEYILCYQKNINNENFVGLVNDGGDAPLLNETNKENVLTFPSSYVRTNLKDGIYKKGTKERVELLNDVIVENGIIKNSFSLKGKFRWQQKSLDEEIEKKCLLIVKSDKFAIRYCRVGDRTVAPQNYLAERFYQKDSTIDKASQNVDTNEKAGKEISELLEHNVFDFPKPTSLIAYLLSFVEMKDSLILDFFSGSATTAHACMQLNAEDGGRRQFIMVQLPVECEPSSTAAKAGFKNICEIGKERIRRAGKKILGEHPERQGTLDVGFKVYRLAKSNIKPYTPTTGSDETALELALGSMESQITPLRDGFDFQNPADIHSLLTEILLRQGFSLDSRIEKSTSVAGNTLYRIIDEKRPVVLNVCLDGSIAKETVQGIAFGENDKFVCLNSAISDELYAQLSDKGRVETL